MSNSGSGAFITTDDLLVTVPLSWILAALDHLQEGTEDARATADGLAECLPRVPVAHMRRLAEMRGGDDEDEDDDDDLAEVEPER